MSLRLDWCNHEAAKHAVHRWHYSRSMPAGKLARIGVWEGGVFKGVILFGRGANNHIGSQYGLDQTEVCECVRIALAAHEAPVSRCLSVAIRMLRRHSPGLRLLVSYADPERDHHGGVYQASNWIFVGKSQAQQEVLVRGQVMHKRTANSRFGTIRGLKRSPVFWKFKYLYPLDEEVRSQVERHRQPYPKRADIAAA
jgi:hypothetical protein